MTKTRQEIDLVAIRKKVPLRQFVESCGVSFSTDGDNWRGQCPLHQEQHGASFLLYPNQRWYCHGKCACGGDVISFAQAFWNESLERTIERLLGNEQIPYKSKGAARVVLKHEPRWPDLDPIRIRELLEPGWGLYDLWERSPVRYDDVDADDHPASHAEEVIDSVFPGDPWLCCGWTQSDFATQRREDWRGFLGRQAFIVPNPMLGPYGLTQGNRLSQHSKEATARRVYLVIEFDFGQKDASEIKGKRARARQEAINQLLEEWEQQGITISEVCAALHLDLARRRPLVLAVHSGGKSIHGWYYVYKETDEHLFSFMQYAYSIGADHVTWLRSQFVRMPDGTRQSGERQTVFYFDPSKSVHL